MDHHAKNQGLRFARSAAANHPGDVNAVAVGLVVLRGKEGIQFTVAMQIDNESASIRQGVPVRHMATGGRDQLRPDQFVSGAVSIPDNQARPLVRAAVLALRQRESQQFSGKYSANPLDPTKLILTT